MSRLLGRRPSLPRDLARRLTLETYLKKLPEPPSECD